MNGNTHEGWQAQADARCTPTARRVAAVELLIAQGYTWRGGAWVSPAKPEAVRLRDELREGGLTDKQVYDQFEFLEGMVNAPTYRLIVDRAINIQQAALAATGKQQAGEVEPADDDWHLRGYAYASKQATTCASCGKHAHTPLRIDAMGGYVCLTCIDQKLGTLLNELGYQSEQVGKNHLREAIATVCEGWTLPADARKILEKAMWEYPTAQAVDLGQFRDAVVQARYRYRGDKEATANCDRLLALIDGQA